MPRVPRIHPPEVWDAARDAYMAGETAQSVCDRLGLNIRAFRARARRCGWRRRDLVDAQWSEQDQDWWLLADISLDNDSDLPWPVEAGVGFAGATDARTLAWRRARREIDRGQAMEAWRWLRIVERLDRRVTTESYGVDDALRAQAALEGQDPADVTPEAAGPIHLIHPPVRSAAG